MFSLSVDIFKLVELTALSSRTGRAVATILNYCVSLSHDSAARFLRSGDKYYIYSVDN